MCERGTLANRKRRCVGVISSTPCTLTLKEGSKSALRGTGSGQNLWPLSCLAGKHAGLEVSSAWAPHDGPASAGGIWLGSCLTYSRERNKKAHLKQQLNYQRAEGLTANATKSLFLILSYRNIDEASENLKKNFQHSVVSANTFLFCLVVI